MFEFTKLNTHQVQLYRDTMSANSFYMLVGDALKAKKRLSVVRMGDGEQALLKECFNDSDDIYFSSLPNDLMQTLGCYGITKTELYNRLIEAGNKCTYFAPSISGVHSPKFNLYGYFKQRTRYVDNFFVNAWDEEMKINLFKEAKHVLFIHRNASTADAMQIRAQGGLGVKVSFIKLDNWKETGDVIEKANKNNAPLVLFSGGPAGKYIAPIISSKGNIPKVVLDLGNAADHWTFSSLKHITVEQAQTFAANYKK